MKRISIILIIFIIALYGNNVLGQKQQTYKSNGTTYITGESYTTTGQPKVKRSESAKDAFLKSKGYNKVPPGYQVDHIKPLSEGGQDVPANMQLIPIRQHQAKTANERAKNTSSTYVAPKYRSSSTNTGSSRYSTPSSTGSNKTIYSGPKGGQYYINGKGNKTYIKKK
jgi:hypothetical protein